MWHTEVIDYEMGTDGWAKNPTYLVQTTVWIAYCLWIEKVRFELGERKLFNIVICFPLCDVMVLLDVISW